jgi:maltose O-acetyltransferase
MFGGTVRGEIVVHQGAGLEIGDDVFINYGASISAERSVRIGAGCHIGQYAIVNDGDQHSIGDLHSRGLAAPIVIGEGAWLGARVIVLKGVTIGAGAVIGAGSVVTRSIPARSIAAGAPARVIRQLDW